MYIHHPLSTDEFDFNVFADSNFETLNALYDEICELIPGPFALDETIDKRASFLTFAVFNDAISLEDIEEDSSTFDDDQRADKFFEHATSFCTLLSMQKSDLAEYDPESMTWSSTSLGREKANRLMKVKLHGFLEE